MPVTKRDLEDIHSYCSTAVGYYVKLTRRVGDYGFNPIVIGLVSSLDVRESEIAIYGTNALWSLENDAQFICGSFDKPEFIESQIALLEGTVLRSVQIEKPLFEATFLFDNNIRLRFFPINPRQMNHWTMQIFGKTKLTLGPGTNFYIKPFEVKPKKES